MKKVFSEHKSFIAVLLLGLALRLISLNQSFWLDEATSGVVVRDLSYKEIFTNFLPGDFHPPFYYIFLKVWSGVLGTSEMGLRSLSVAAGVFNIWLIYLIGNYLLNKRAALLGSLLLSFSGLHLYFSQEARMYVLASLFVSCSVFFLAKTFKEGGPGDWFWFSLFLTLSSLTHYLTLLMIPSYWLYGFFKKPKKPWWRNFLMSHNILVIPFIFWLPVFLKQLKVGLEVSLSSPGWWDVLGRTSVKEIALVPIKFIIGRVSFEDKTTYTFLVIFLFFLVGYWLYWSAKSLKKNLVFWLWLGVPFLLALIIGLNISVFSYFRLLFILPAFYLLVTIGILAMPKKWSTISVLILVFINLSTSFVYLFNPRFHRENWRLLVDFVEGQRSHDSEVVFVANSQMEAYRYYAPNSLLVGPDNLTEDAQQLWLMRYVQPIFDPQDKLRARVESWGFKKIAENDFNGVVVWEYVK